MPEERKSVLTEKAEFHINDLVCLLYAGKPVSFVINQITSSASGKKFYQGEGSGGWQPEDRLDYDLTEQQKTMIRSVENALFNLNCAANALLELMPAAYNMKIPGSTINLFRCEISEAKAKL